jgi:head-tail adaptor
MKLKTKQNYNGTELDTNQLRELTTLQVLTADGTWTSDQDVWALVDDLGVPGMVTTKPTHRVYTRYLDTVTTVKRFLWGTKELYVSKVRDILTRQRWMEIECSEARLANWVVDNGKTVTMHTFATETFDPNTGVVTRGAETSHTPLVAGPEPYEQNIIDGDLIRFGDAEIHIPEEQITFVPALGQKVTIDSETWSIISIRKHYLGEYVDAYTCQIRQ